MQLRWSRLRSVLIAAQGPVRRCGDHKFTVRAVNQYGLRDPNPPSASWVAVGQTPVFNLCGTIKHNETLSPSAAKVFVMTCDVAVEPGVALRLEPGTIIKAQSGARLEVHGSLVSAGTAGSPVTLTSIRDSSVGGNTIGEETTPSAGEWQGVTVDVGSGGLTRPVVSLEHTVVSYESSVSVSQASSVSVLNSQFVRYRASRVVVAMGSCRCLRKGRSM